MVIAGPTCTWDKNPRLFGSNWAGKHIILRSCPLMACVMLQRGPSLNAKRSAHPPPENRVICFTTYSQSLPLMSYVDVSSIVDSGFHLIPEPDKISRYSEIAHALTPISQSASIIKHVEVSQNTFRPRGSHYSRKYLRTITMNGRTGVSVADALEAKFDGLDNAKEPFFTTLGNSTKGTIRIEVHGYPPYSQQIPIRDGKRQSKALDMGKQSHAIAKAISKMIEDYQYIDVGANHRWKLGPDGIIVEHLLLVDVYQVSVNSFQPTLFVAYKH